MSQGPIGLLIPALSSELVNDSLFSLTEIQHWIGELSMENSGVTTKLLADHLHASQCCNVSPTIRLAMLEALTPPIETISDILEEKYLKGTNLSPDVRRKVGTLAETIEIELLMGYKTVIEQLSINIRANKNALLLSLHRFFNITQTILFRAQQFYSKPPAGLWKECHLVYYFCEINHLLNKHIDDSNYLKRSIKHATLLDAYLHTIIFALSDPHRLNSVEMGQLNEAANTWSSHVKLVPFNKAIHYAIDLADDHAPISQLYLSKTAPAEECRSVVLEGLVEMLSSALHRINTQTNAKFTAQGVSSELGVSKTTLTKLLQNWKEALDRGDKRIDIHGECTVYGGLTTIHQALQEKDPQLTLKHFECNLVNMSNSGVCIKWSIEIPQGFETGSVIGLSSPQLTENKIWVGTVQWIKKSDTSWDMGIHHISKDTTPIQATLTNPENQKLSDDLPCLLLGPLNEVPHKSLITGLMPFKPGSLLKVKDGDNQYTMTLGSNLAKTNTIIRFNIEGLL